MPSLAIIGTGISGLGCAHFLHRRFDLTIYEQNDYPGGHSNTVSAQEGAREVPIDTGFMVYNEVTYPNLTRLFRQLDVATMPTDMSFSVQHLPSGLEYNGSNFNQLFGQRRNLFSPRFWTLLLSIDRFNREAIQALEGSKFTRETIGEYLRARRYGDDFANLYLVPMTAAIWSTQPGQILEFPAWTMLRFLYNHGLLGMRTQHPWRTVCGGSRSYVKKIIAPFKERIRMGDRARSVIREQDKVRVVSEDGSSAIYDKVILATHADQALRVLGEPTLLESRLLRAFRYNQNIALLHTDCSAMPKTRRCWASWNYRIGVAGNGSNGASQLPSTHYWMNRLQKVSEAENYFVSLNFEDHVAPEKVLKRIEYEHPLFDHRAIAAQQELPGLNRPDGTVFFCGSYFKYGFHEDGLTSALQCVESITGEPAWS